MEDGVATSAPCRLLHVIVGHKFPTYFENAINSVVRMTTNDGILVVDNASNESSIIRRLQALADAHPRVRLVLRSTNDLSRNTKVGGLYDAYNEVMTYALEQGYDYVHIMQHDMQMLWWDESIIRRAGEIFAEYPECVNISMQVPSVTLRLSDLLDYVKPKLIRLSRYGLTDTGLYDMAKWRARDMRFSDSETAHALKYLNQGLQVFIHPLPAVAPIPWPAVVRSGKVVGHEVKSRRELLLRPLTPAQITAAKESTDPVWSEEICVPWGWTCLTPYWTSDLRNIGYLVSLYRAIRRRGLRAAWPRWERRGLSAGSLRGVQRQPRFGMLAVVAVPAWHSLRRTITRSRFSKRSR
jgi:glycosyltransferase involved in cell wall biosynthesis